MKKISEVGLRTMGALLGTLSILGCTDPIEKEIHTTFKEKKNIVMRLAMSNYAVDDYFVSFREKHCDYKSHHYYRSGDYILSGTVRIVLLSEDGTTLFSFDRHTNFWERCRARSDDGSYVHPVIYQGFAKSAPYFPREGAWELDYEHHQEIYDTIVQVIEAGSVHSVKIYFESDNQKNYVKEGKLFNDTPRNFDFSPSYSDDYNVYRTIYEDAVVFDIYFDALIPKP